MPAAVLAAVTPFKQVMMGKNPSAKIVNIVINSFGKRFFHAMAFCLERVYDTGVIVWV